MSAISPRRPQLDAGYGPGVADDVADAISWGMPAPPPGRLARLFENRVNYLAAALCLALATVMLLPLLASVLASFKSTAEAAAVPPTYFPHALSLDSYSRLWHFQAGLPTYLANSGGAALLTILFCLVLTIPAGYGLARFPVPGK